MISDPRNNLWEASCAEDAGAAPLDRDMNVDLAVIGGGFTGNAAALEAAKSGASVCLMEARRIGHGGSGRNVGLVNAGLWLPPEDVFAQIGEEAGTRLLSVLAEAPGRVFSLIEAHGIECEATRAGTLHCAHSPGGLKDLQNRLRQGIRLGAPLQLCDAEETARRTGAMGLHGALFDPRAGTVQPLGYCHGLARAAREAGAHLHDNTPVTGIAREGDNWVVSAGRHKVGARALLIATNAYHLGIEAPYRPEFTTVSFFQCATEPMPDAVRESVLPGGEGCWDTALVMSSFRIDRQGRLIVGGIGDLDGPGRAIHQSWARRKLRELFPRAGQLPFAHAWCGRIAMTSDHIPKILEFGPNALACFGYSGRGIAPGTAFGTAAAKALLTGSSEALPLDPIRHYSERFKAVRRAYYELGAALAHALPKSKQH